MRRQNSYQNAIEFSEVKLRDCLLPRNEITAVPLNTPKEELLEIFSKSGYSKIIVYHEDMDDVIGYIHTVGDVQPDRSGQLARESSQSFTSPNYRVQKVP